MDIEIYHLAEAAGRFLQSRGWMLTTAESCTGGWISQAITMIPGSSEWFDRGFVTYTNRAKMEMLGISADTLREHGAVSEATVSEMVRGAIEQSSASLAVAVSGVAGPAGGTAAKPVGTVCIAWMLRGQAPIVRTHLIGGDRDGVRRTTVIEAMKGILDFGDRASPSI